MHNSTIFEINMYKNLRLENQYLLLFYDLVSIIHCHLPAGGCCKIEKAVNSNLRLLAKSSSVSP